MLKWICRLGQLTWNDPIVYLVNKKNQPELFLHVNYLLYMCMYHVFANEDKRFKLKTYMYSAVNEFMVIQIPY